jgi:hypothetical protein
METPLNHRVSTAAVALVIVLCALLSLPVLSDARQHRIRLAYVPPVAAAHQPLYARLRQQRLLERVGAYLRGLRLPRSLRLTVAGCDGEANAWYDPEAREVTVCYEYLAHVQRLAPTETIGGVTPEDAVVGPFLEVVLHEVGHALFDLLRVPILGREEDAADQLAAYIMLQLGQGFARTAIVGVAWMYAQEAQGATVDRSAFADVHSLDGQRFYTVLCLAYGADPRLFADAVEKGHLPQERAEGCADEYRQVAYAVQRLLSPPIDKGRAKLVMAKKAARSSESHDGACGLMAPHQRQGCLGCLDEGCACAVTYGHASLDVGGACRRRARAGPVACTRAPRQREAWTSLSMAATSAFAPAPHRDTTLTASVKGTSRGCTRVRSRM